MRSCAHWLNWKCGIAMGAAREKVRVAQCLQHLPLIDAAFASGQISYSKVRAMTRVATADNEEFLLMIAQQAPPAIWRSWWASTRRCSAPCRIRPSGERERAPALFLPGRRRHVDHPRQTAAGGGPLVIKAIEAVAESIRLTLNRQRRVSVESVQDDAISHRVAPQNVSAETFSNEVNNDATDGHRINFEQSRADALVSMAEHCLATAGMPPTRKASGAVSAAR